MNATRRLTIITGMSGAGKSTALHALEDLGAFCTDNLPPSLLVPWLNAVEDKGKPMAVCLDTRSGTPEDLAEAIANLPVDCFLIFLDADDAVLMRRFSTVRRRHPFDPKSQLPTAIEEERQALKSLRDGANMIIDTSTLTPYELAALVEEAYRKHFHSQSSMIVSLISFSYQRGLPQEADMVIDVRHLPNPHYRPELAPLTGKDQPVVEFLMRKKGVKETEEMLQAWIQFLWPRMREERKQYFTLAFGCSGGRHRSVYMAERMAQWFRDQGLSDPIVRHRDLAPEKEV